jgi:drug/metabolite transporter (DMT)-like permease
VSTICNQMRRFHGKKTLYLNSCYTLLMKLSVKQLAVLSLCFVAFCFVLLGVVTRMMNEGVGPFMQVYTRIGGAFLLALVLFYKKISFHKLKHISSKDWFLLTIMGSIGYGLAVIFVTFSILHTKLLNVAVISSTVPFFALLYVSVITKKSISPLQILFLIISFIGVYLIATKSLSLVIHSFGLGELYALLFAAGSGAFVVSRKFISKNLSNPEITVIIIFIAFISSFLGAMVMGEPLDFSGFSNPFVALGLVMGIILNVTTTQLQNFSFQKLNAVAGSQLLLLQNVFAPILGLLLYKETILPIEFLGAVLILIGVFGYYKKAAD